MTAQSVLTAVAVLVAVAALLRARRIAKRLDRMVESYWELRHEYGELRAHVDKLQGKTGAEPAAPGSTAFVPLSSIRRT